MRTKNPDRMDQILAYIESFYSDYSYTPTTQQIANVVGTSKATAYRYLVALADQHKITYRNGCISTEKIRKMSPEINRAALVGSIPCGTPEEREAQVESYVPLPISIFGDGDFYVLRASGDSMIDAGIHSEDLVVIEQCLEAHVGDIVVALTDDNSSTLKRLCYDEQQECYYLHPENRNYDDIYVQNLQIQGIARNVIRSL